MHRSRKRVAYTVILTLILGLLVGFSTIGAVDTTTAVSTSPGSPVTGQEVTVTWTVTAQTSSTVTFGGNLSRRIKSPGSGTWDILDDSPATSGTTNPFISTKKFTPERAGTYTIEGAYAGGGSPVLDGSSGSALLVVDKANTTVTVTSAKDAGGTAFPAGEPVTGQDIVFTATVAAVTTGTPTGTVTFYANGTPIAGGQNVMLADDGGNQVATCTASFNAADSPMPMPITAAYGGDANYSGSDNTAAPLFQTVNPADTTTAVTSTPAPSVTGQDVTFTATVTTDTPGSGTPTGTVTFTVKDKNDAVVTTSAALALDGLGQATYTMNALKASLSKYKVTATYNGSGDDNYNSSPPSDIYEQQVDKADTSIAITSDNPDPSFEGESYTVKWTVSVTGPGSDIGGTLPPTGDVDVEDDEATPNTCTSAVGNGTTGCSITSTIAATATLTATYNPPTSGANYNTSDTTESHTVNSAETSTTVTSDINPSVIGQSVTFTATITPAASGGDPIGGTAEFFIDDDATPGPSGSDTSFGTASVSTGLATKPHPFTAADSYDIYAVYNGDGEIKSGEVFYYKTSTSANYAQTVDNANTTTTIETDLSAATVVGEAYTVSGRVYVDAPGGGVASIAGEVTVSDGSASCTDTTLVWNASGYWDWSCPTPTNPLTSTTAGTKTITATFIPDATDDLNTSMDTTSHPVNKGTVSIAIAAANDGGGDTVTDGWASGETGLFTATVTASGSASGTPTGTVSFHIEDAGGVTITDSGPHLLSSSANSSSVTLFASQSQVKVVVSYSGDTNFAATSNTYYQTVTALGRRLQPGSHLRWDWVPC